MFYGTLMLSFISQINHNYNVYTNLSNKLCTMVHNKIYELHVYVIF